MISVIFKNAEGGVLLRTTLPVVPRKGEVVHLPDRSAHIKERVREVEYRVHSLGVMTVHVTIDQYFVG